MSTEHNMANLIAKNVYKLQLITFKTEHSKPIILCVLSGLVKPTTVSFNRTPSVTYCV
jgi:hypothetical protein